MLGFAGMDQDIPYEVQYTTLSPGVVQLQAFRGRGGWHDGLLMEMLAEELTDDRADD